jgi:hypothetical protein
MAAECIPFARNVDLHAISGPGRNLAEDFEFLTQLCHETTHVRTLGMQRAPDAQVIALARTGGSVVPASISISVTFWRFASGRAEPDSVSPRRRTPRVRQWTAVNVC